MLSSGSKPRKVAMSKRTTLEDRVQIVSLAGAGLNDPQIAGRTGWSVHTVRKVRRREQRYGRAGLASRTGRPARGPLSTYSHEIRDTLRAMRQAHPGWGPQTLRVELEQEAHFAGQALPSVASIERFLRAEKLSRSYQKRSDLPEPARQPAEAPHDVWEMDARGHSRVPDVGVVSLVNLNDRCSHARLLSYPVWLGDRRCTRYANTEDYQTALRLAFTDWGLPKQLQVDRGPVFIDNRTGSPFPTRLHLWLVALGVDVLFGRPSRPTDQGMTERSHQLWARQCLMGAHYQDWDQLYRTLRERRDRLNHDLPCASLGSQPPLVAFPQAAHSGRDYRPEWERDLLDLSRVWAYLAQGRWFRKTSKDTTFTLSRRVYYLGKPWRHTQLDITFDPADQHLVCHNAAGELVARCPIQGLSVDELMGMMAAYINLPLFQLALPFDWTDLQPVRLFEVFPVRLSEV
jgi:transposase